MWFAQRALLHVATRAGLIAPEAVCRFGMLARSRPMSEAGRRVDYFGGRWTCWMHAPIGALGCGCARRNADSQSSGRSAPPGPGWGGGCAPPFAGCGPPGAPLGAIEGATGIVGVCRAPKSADATAIEIRAVTVNAANNSTTCLRICRLPFVRIPRLPLAQCAAASAEIMNRSPRMGRQNALARLRVLGRLRLTPF
jgi:hypothetical protein